MVLSAVSAGSRKQRRYGPVAGGFVGGHFGMRSVFLGTCLIMMLGAFYNWTVLRRNP